MLLGLRRRNGRTLLGLLEVFDTKEDGNSQKAHHEHGAQIAAAAATTAGALRLKIGILEFGQRVTSCRSKSSGDRRWFYGNGSWETGCWVEGRGTWSSPPRLKGWQRKILPTASAVPRSGPCRAMAVTA